MASKGIPISKDDNDIKEDPPRASKQRGILQNLQKKDLPTSSNLQKGIWKESPRASKQKGILQNLQEKDPPTSCSVERPRASEQEGIWKAGEDPLTSFSAETTIEQDSCPHREPFPRLCTLCGKTFPVVCRAPPEYMRLGWG